MAYTNKISPVLFLVVAISISSRLIDAQTPAFPKMTPVCAQVLPDLLEKCFATVRDKPTDECCSDLKSATTTQVTCLCDNYIANPAFVNITGPYSAGITTKCGVFDKFSCDGTSKGEEEKNEEGRSSSNGNGKSTNEGNGGIANNVSASMAVFGLFASIMFFLF